MRHAALVSLCVASGCLTLLLLGGLTWNGADFAMYVSAGHHLPGASPYEVALYRYSPAFAYLILLFPSGAVGLALWRLGSLMALILVVRRVTTPAFIALTAPAVVFDLASGNVMTFALALMVAVMRWPSVLAATGYAIFVMLIPKPVFLPVLLWALVKVPGARRVMFAAGLCGIAMLAYPGYLARLLSSGDELGALIGLNLHVAPWFTAALIAMGGILAVIAIWRPGLLGIASVLTAGYWWPYVFAPLGLTVIPVSERARSALRPPVPVGEQSTGSAGGAILG